MNATAGTCSSVFQLDCGRDLLLDIQRNITQAMLIGESFSCGCSYDVGFLERYFLISIFWKDKFKNKNNQTKNKNKKEEEDNNDDDDVLGNLLRMLM